MRLIKFSKRMACACVLVITIASGAFAEVEPNIEVHKIIGGLYSLAAVAKLNDGNITTQQLVRYFGKDAAQWLADVKIEKQGKTLWVGVPVEQFSTARRFLRNFAAELQITDTPAGNAWFSGDYAWLAVTSLSLKAARGTAPDTGILFLSADGTEFWWQNLPALTNDTASTVLKKWGVNAADLHVPAGDGNEKFQASPVGLPEEFHTTSNRDPFAVDVGDNLIFNPIPRTSTD